MAMYNVLNLKAQPGQTSSALIITGGSRKAKFAFVDRFGGNLADLHVDRVNVNDAGPEGYRVYGSWDEA